MELLGAEAVRRVRVWRWMAMITGLVAILALASHRSAGWVWLVGATWLLHVCGSMVLQYGIVSRYAALRTEGSATAGWLLPLALLLGSAAAVVAFAGAPPPLDRAANVVAPLGIVVYAGVSFRVGVGVLSMLRGEPMAAHVRGLKALAGLIGFFGVFAGLSGTVMDWTWIAWITLPAFCWYAVICRRTNPESGVLFKRPGEAGS